MLENNSLLNRFCNLVTTLSVVVLLLTGCAAGLQPVDSPLEVTPAPSQAMQWIAKQMSVTETASGKQGGVYLALTFRHQITRRTEEWS